MTSLSLTIYEGRGVTFVLRDGRRIRVVLKQVRPKGRVVLQMHAPTDVPIVRDEIMDSYERGAVNGTIPKMYDRNGRCVSPATADKAPSPSQAAAAGAPLVAHGPDSTDRTAAARAALGNGG